MTHIFSSETPYLCQRAPIREEGCALQQDKSQIREGAN